MTSKENNNVPILKGLVLVGGKSTRMGQDKSQMQWHGKEQKYFAADLIKPFCKEVFISCRPDQRTQINEGYQILTDTFLDFGPYGGILSALRSDRKAAWLVVACDMPLLDEKTIQNLVENRNPESFATTYESPHDGFPEPLITIWEPSGYAILLDFLGRGYTCPRKALINSDNKTVLKPLNPDALLNANTPEDSKRAREILMQTIKNI